MRVLYFRRLVRMSKRALITGITGQDGSYLADLLIEKEYEVHGIVRNVPNADPDHRLRRIRHALASLVLHEVEPQEQASLNAACLHDIVGIVKPDECYHLAAQSFVSYSFDDEFSIFNTNINDTHHVLSAVHRVAPQCRFYFAGSSEMFGAAEESPQTERTRFRPRSLYGISKVAGFELTRNYREAYQLHATTGILYNHESPRRGHEFVTRKITSAVAKIAAGRQSKLNLGNLAAQRDWGHAREYVQAMWLMLQQEVPDDYVIATGRCHSVEEFVTAAFAVAGLDWRNHVISDQTVFRPAEVNLLRGDATRARERLGWQPATMFPELVREMVQADMELESLKADARTV